MTTNRSLHAVNKIEDLVNSYSSPKCICIIYLKILQQLYKGAADDQFIMILKTLYPFGIISIHQKGLNVYSK